MKFIGFLNQLHAQSKACNGTNLSTEPDVDLAQVATFQLTDQSKHNPDNNSVKYNEGTLNMKPLESTEEGEHWCNKTTNVSENGPSPEEDILHGRGKGIGKESFASAQPKEGLCDGYIFLITSFISMV